MRTEKSRGRYSKKTKNPQAVRNQRVLIFTFVIILALMFQSNHWKLERERLMEMAGGMVVLDGKSQADGGGDVVADGGDQAVDGGDAAGAAVDQSAVDGGAAGAAGDQRMVDGNAVGAAGDQRMVVGDAAGAARDQEMVDGGAAGVAGDQGMDEGDRLIAELDRARAEAETEGQKEEAAEDGLILREEDMWCLILTNARYPVPDDYEVELTKVPGSSQSVDARIYEPLMSMFEAMKAEGLSPLLCSGYRTLDKQEKLFNRKVQTYVRQGYSMEEANGKARQVLSIPGSGEHCLGLAVDIYASSYKKLEIGFENRPEGKWLREHAQDYGFILRYDKGKEEVTGFQYEPWHFRYVGVEVARYLKEYQLSLEEFYIEQSLYG